MGALQACASKPYVTSVLGQQTDNFPLRETAIHLSIKC